MIVALVDITQRLNITNESAPFFHRIDFHRTYMDLNADLCRQPQ